MRLLSVTLRGFRGYLQPTRFEFDDLTTLIGRNDVGKSTVLEALEIFFNNDTVKFDSGDCSIDEPEQIVEITCEFSGFPDALVIDAQATTSLSAEHLLTKDGTLCILKRYTCKTKTPKLEIFVLAHHPSGDGVADLLELTHDKLKARLKSFDSAASGVNLSVSSSIRQAIWSAAPLIFATRAIPVSKEEGKRIWEKLEEYMPRFALFQSDRPSRDSDAEVQDPMKLAIAAALDEPTIRSKLNDVLMTVQERAEALADRTCKTLARLDGSLAESLSTSFKAEPKWNSLFALTLADERGISINKRGSGVRRLVLVSFFMGEAERKLEAGTSRNIIYAVEEPETSQHPNSQRLLVEAFRTLSEQPGCQVILTTHSPSLAQLLPVSGLRFISGQRGQTPTVQSGSDEAIGKIVETLGVMPDGKVKVIVCVEGPNDVVALGCLSRALHQADPELPDLLAHPFVAVLPMGGDTLGQWVAKHYLRGFNTPEAHIYDSDVEKYKGAVDAVNARDDRSWACQTRKLEMENYLHAEVIGKAYPGAADIVFDDHSDLPELIAQKLGMKNHTKIKSHLARAAFPLMRAAHIAERDPDGEVAGWLRRIRGMLDG